MAIQYDQVVPWGRNFDEYVRMFHLTEDDLRKKIIGCGDGPASFNYEATLKGYHITSIDPVYIFSKQQLEKRIEETYEIVIKKTFENKEKFLWNQYKDVDDLGATRMEAMKTFLNDYEIGKEQKRYLVGEFPVLNIDYESYELALCSHLLFLYSDNLSYEFHIQSIEEMLRIANEVRIFPIVDVNANESVHYPKVVGYLKQKYKLVEAVKVDFEFQKGGNKMLRIIK